MHHEPAALEGTAEVLLHADTIEGRRIFGKHLKTILAEALGIVHRRVGLSLEVCGGPAIVRVNCNPHAHRNRQFLAIHYDRLSCGLHQFGRKRRSRRSPVDFR